LQDSNTPTNPREKPHIADAGAAKSAAFDADSGSLADALAMLARLPLSDAERAEAVRRLLAGRPDAAKP
jgi:hypothetical protein